MSRSFNWRIVKPSDPQNSVSLKIAQAIGDAYGVEGADIDELELDHTSLPILRALHSMANVDDQEDLDALIAAVQVSGGRVEFSVER